MIDILIATLFGGVFGLSAGFIFGYVLASDSDTQKEGDYEYYDYHR